MSRILEALDPNAIPDHTWQILFDLEKDPGEFRNIAAEPAARSLKDEMRVALIRRSMEVLDPLPEIVTPCRRPANRSPAVGARAPWPCAHSAPAARNASTAFSPPKANEFESAAATCRRRD